MRIESIYRESLVPPFCSLRVCNTRFGFCFILKLIIARGVPWLCPFEANPFGSGGGDIQGMSELLSSARPPLSPKPLSTTLES